MRSIASALRDAADDRSDAASVKALAKAATTLEGYSRAPSKSAEAVRVARVLTPVVVDVLGEGLRDVLAEDASDTSLRLAGVVEARYAFCGVLVAAASADEQLRASGERAASSILPLVDGVTPREAEALMFLASLVPDSPAAAPVAEAATVRLLREPATPARRWAEGLGLDLPFTRWEIAIEVPGAIRLGHTVRDFPGSRSAFTTYLSGTTRWTTILGDELTPEGAVVDYEHRQDAAIAGRITAPRSLEDLPAVIAALSAASPGIALDTAAAKVRAFPASALRAPGKRRVVAWLQA